MEFVSLGGLMQGLRAEDLFIGVSQLRNERLANVFYHLEQIEAYGTGIQRIMRYYEDFDVKPEITAPQGAFMLTLPNMKHKRALRAKRQEKSQHKTVLYYLQDNPFITNEIVQELNAVKQTRAYAIIKEMVGEGYIVKSGSGREDHEYILSEGRDFSTGRSKNIKKGRSILRGCLRGKVWMADDFDAPLEEMQDYM
jgi:ATP-dependent DNA helicase RecG